MKKYTITFILFVFSISSYSQKYSLGLNTGHTRFIDNWVSGLNTEVYFLDGFTP